MIIVKVKIKINSKNILNMHRLFGGKKKAPPPKKPQGPPPKKKAPVKQVDLSAQSEKMGAKEKVL